MTLKIDFDESHHHRKASDIFEMIECSNLAPRVKSRSKAIFTTIGQAEAKYTVCHSKTSIFMKLVL